MLMKCKTFKTELIPARKNNVNCNKCIVFQKKQKTQPEGATLIKEESES